MKITLILILVACLSGSAEGVEGQRISLSVTNVKLEKVFQEIKKQTGYVFFYDRRILEDAERVSVHVKSKTVEETLRKSLVGQPLGFEITKKTVTIFPSTAHLANHVLPDMESSSLTLPVEAPRAIIAGTVRDANGTPLVGVSVIVKGTTRGTSTGNDGRYSIDADPGQTLVFTFVGYNAIENVVGSGSVMNVTMVTSVASGLDEVVVVGYGTQTKATITGSISTVQGEQINRSPSINIGSSLQGLLPGTMALQSSGEPGRGDPTMYVRGISTLGNNNPLVVVDGVPDFPGWQYLSSDDIASISVLKDASAAIYGARAANGVILITTKRGISGRPNITYSFNQGFSSPTLVPKVATSYQFAGYVNQLNEEQGQPPIFGEVEMEKFRTGSDPEHYGNYDWFKELTKKLTPQSQHSLNIRGGSEDVKFLISGIYSHQNSLFKNGSLDYKTYGITSNLDAKINRYIKVALDLNGGINDGNYPSYSTTTAFEGILQQLPWRPVYWSNGLPSGGIERGENPVIEVSSLTGNNNNKRKRFVSKISLDVSVPWVSGLDIGGFFAYTDYQTLVKNWQTPWTVYNYDSLTNKYIPINGGGILAPQLTQSSNTIVSKLLNLRINYKKDFGSSSLSAFVAGEQEEITSSNFMAFRRDFISSSIDELFAGGLNNQKTDGSKSISGRQSLFGRLSYGFQEKYLMDMNFRYDGSSNFAKGKRFGFFPGVSVAWRLSKENFLHELDFLNDLKLRASYGQIGNDRIDPFQYLNLFKLTTGYAFGNPPLLGQGLVAGVTPNPNVTWEVAKITNIGLDGTLWNGALDFSFDFFKQKRSNILTTRFAEIPIFSGLVLPNENIGVVENKGFESKISGTDRFGKFLLRLELNASFQKSRIIDISEPSGILAWQSAQGHPIGSKVYYQAEGIFRTQEEVDKNPIFPGTKVGDLKYKDVNGDGSITAEDMVIDNRTNIPRISYGFNFSLQYQGFSLWANFVGYAKVWQSYHLNARNAMNSLADLINNRYVPGSMDSKYPRLPTIESAAGEPSGLVSTFWLFNTSYLRLQTLELGYDFPKSFLSDLKINSFRLYLNGNNLLTVSKFKLFDPANAQGNGYYYPLMAVYNVGFKINF